MTNRVRMTDKIMTAVITGGHEYDVMAMHSLFRGMPEVDFYPQHLEDFVTDAGNARKDYDVVLFYNMQLDTPGSDQGDLGRATKEALEEMGESDQGIFILHHAIVAFPHWQPWTDICGISKRSGISGYVEQQIRIGIQNPGHPITRGLTSWDMVDETYIMDDPAEGSDILLTTDCPKSMKAIAWTRRYKNSRVLCYQSGHDSLAYSNPQFRVVIARGIQWLARMI